MAFTITAVEPLKNTPALQGQARTVIRDIVISSYTTGGETLTAATLGLQKILYVDGQFDEANKHASYDYANSKLLSWGATGTQTSSTTAITHRIRVVGI